MYVFSWFIVKFVLLYYVCAKDVRDCTYRETEWTKTFIVTCFDYYAVVALILCKRTKVNVKK